MCIVCHLLAHSALYVQSMSPVSTQCIVCAESLPDRPGTGEKCWKFQKLSRRDYLTIPVNIHLHSPYRSVTSWLGARAGPPQTTTNSYVVGIDYWDLYLTFGRNISGDLVGLHAIFAKFTRAKSTLYVLHMRLWNFQTKHTLSGHLVA